MKPLIPDYKRQDYGASRALWQELTEHHREIYGDPSIGGADPGEGFDAYLAHPQRRASWVVEAEGQMVALAGLLVTGREAEIEPVVVSSLYRSRGIGTELLRHVMQEANRMGIRCITVRPVARNKRAVALFVRLGFDLLGGVELLQDLSGAPRDRCLTGLSIHGHKPGY